MKRIILPFWALLYCSMAIGQQAFKAIIKDNETNEPLIGATAVLKGTTNGNNADRDGKIDSLKAIDILMKANEQELEEVVVSSTRTSRTIANTPTRIETIELEEIDEKTNMRPANVSMLLHESTGIQVQQTSATSANASIRLQGLDGRYTQLLKDGYPNFGNFSSGLSILEIPPLDLRQVEIIKGPASTLNGGGAIAGVVNFISKTPGEKSEYSFIANQSHIGQTNMGVFASQRKNKIGYTMLALGNFQQAYDVDKDDFTEVPKSIDFTIHPKIFIYTTDKSMLMIGNSFTKGDRLGGDINVIKHKADNYHTYFEENNTLRNTSALEFDMKFNESSHLTIRNSFSYFERNIDLPDYTFKGLNNNLFTDVAYIHNYKNQVLIVGANFIYDNFLQKDSTIILKKDFTSNTSGIYVQHTWDFREKIKVESGLRMDAVNYFNSNYKKNQAFVLPRLSILFKVNDKLSSRIGGGLGYKTPTIFTEETESFQYRNVLPLSNVTTENSYGGTADINYKTAIGEKLYFAINQLFFYTTIVNAAVIQVDTTGKYFFKNTEKLVNSFGFEINAKLIYKENLKLFIGYTYTDAKAEYLSGNQFLPLLPRNKLNLALVFEKAGKYKIGLESYFSDRQYLTNGSKTSSFWENGIMAEKTFGKVSIYANAENITDVRQSRYKRVVNEPHNIPTFDDIWTHTEGFVFSGGIKIKL